MFSVLKDKLIVTDNGRTSGTLIGNSCAENATSIPISVYGLFPMGKYDGCGRWINDFGDDFKMHSIKGDDSNVTFYSNFGILTVKILNHRKDTIRISKIDEVMDDRAVFAITSDGWKVVDIFMFSFNFPDMTGFNTYAFRDGILRKCKITVKDQRVDYLIFD